MPDRPGSGAWRRSRGAEAQALARSDARDEVLSPGPARRGNSRFNRRPIWPILWGCPGTASGRSRSRMHPTRNFGLAAAVLMAPALLALAPGNSDAWPGRHSLAARDSALHVLDRFAYGPRPGDVDRVARQGALAW